MKADVVGNDRDGDTVTFLYEWARNGESAGSRDTLGGPFKRGDKISLKITTYDGEDYGRTVLVTTDIYNSPPKIAADGSAHFDDKNYSYQMKATDLDGDILTYSLKNAPSGMSVGPSTGLIKWNVPPDFRGKISFAASVTDGQGGETLQSLAIEVSAR